jgi:hypothetical protein
MDHTVPALRAAVIAMNEIVIPAVDPNHPLAREQAKIVSGLLAMLSTRLPHLHARAVFELVHYQDVAAAVHDDATEVSPSLARELSAMSGKADDLLSSARTATLDLREAAGRLAQVVTALVRAAGRSESPAARRIEATVLDRAKTLLDGQRSWFLPQGWETDPGAVPPIDEALVVTRQAN